MSVLVTGASGFVGKALCTQLKAQGIRYRAVIRRESQISDNSDFILIDSIDGQTDWEKALVGITVVVHLAARVHVMNEISKDPLNEFRRVNVEGSVNLANQASLAGVTRFIYISTVKVNGESTNIGQAFTAHDVPSPKDSYGLSKLEAESQIQRISRQTAMEYVIIRPPLIYGANVKGNFNFLERLLVRGTPLPFVGITGNRRSLVSLSNFVDLLILCLTHQAAANNIFLVSDDEDISTAELINRICIARRLPNRNFYLPLFVIRLSMLAIGKSDVYQRLCGSLQLDIEKTKNKLKWKPIETLDEALKCNSYSTHENPPT